MMQMQIKVDITYQIVKFKDLGSVASSHGTQMIIKTVEEALRLQTKDVVDELAVSL